MHAPVGTHQRQKTEDTARDEEDNSQDKSDADRLGFLQLRSHELCEGVVRGRLSSVARSLRIHTNPAAACLCGARPSVLVSRTDTAEGTEDGGTGQKGERDRRHQQGEAISTVATENANLLLFVDPIGDGRRIHQ